MRLIPLHGVVGGVIHAAGTLTTEADVQRRQREMLQKWRVIRSRPKRRDAERRVLLGVTAIGFWMSKHRATARFLEHRLSRTWVHDVFRHFAKELLQTMRSTGAQPAFTGAVGIDVGDSLLLQLRFVFLCPLGGAEQSPLFAVPQSEDDRARRTPSRLQQLAKTARGLHQR